MNQSFLNQVDLASSLQVVAPIDSKRPDVVAEKTMDTWLTPFGIPTANHTDGGGEFEAEFADLMDSLGVKPLRAAAYSPTNSAPIERAGGAWKYVARMVIDSCQLTFKRPWVVKWLCVVVNWARNSEPDESGFSPSQWVLGKGIKLPFDALSPAARLAVMSRTGERDFSLRLSMLQQALRASRALRISRGLHASLTKRARGLGTLPIATMLAIGDQVMVWRGDRKTKAQWAERWQGPALVIGFEGNSVWVPHKHQTMKCAARHIRHCTPDELLPWYTIFDEAYSGRVAPRAPPAPTPGPPQQRWTGGRLEFTSIPPTGRARAASKAPKATAAAKGPVRGRAKSPRPSP